MLFYWYMTRVHAVLLCLLLLPFSVEAQFNFLPDLTPAEPLSVVDIVVESDTIIPTLYRGRAEPVPGSTMRLTAIPHTIGTTSLENLRYHWNVGGSVSDGAAATIEHQTTILPTVPVSLQVFTADGRLLARADEIIALSDPTVVFYEENPLRGLSRVAIGDTHVLTGEETTVRGVGYFFSPSVFEVGSVWQWSVDHQEVTVAEAQPWSITLQKPTRPQGHLIELFVGNARNTLQTAARQFTFLDTI